MPRKRLRPHRRRHIGYTDRHIYQLLTGHDWLGVAFGHDDVNHDCDREGMRECWEELKDDILSAWVAEYPGSRPWAWWELDAPEPRRCLNGLHPFENARRQKYVKAWSCEHPRPARAAHALHWGRPTTLIPLRDDAGDLDMSDFDREYESEADYLARLDLLQPGEAERIREGVDWDSASTAEHKRFADAVFAACANEWSASDVPA